VGWDIQETVSAGYDGAEMERVLCEAENPALSQFLLEMNWVAP
jgi:hypothetical protein